MLISLLIFVIVIGLLYWLITMLPLPEPFKTIVLCIFVLLCIIWLLGSTGVMGATPFAWHAHRFVN